MLYSYSGYITALLTVIYYSEGLSGTSRRLGGFLEALKALWVSFSMIQVLGYEPPKAYMLLFSAQHMIGSPKHYREYVLNPVESNMNRSKQLKSCKPTKIQENT
jgi:hypothetical protein